MLHKYLIKILRDESSLRDRKFSNGKFTVETHHFFLFFENGRNCISKKMYKKMQSHLLCFTISCTFRTNFSGRNVVIVSLESYDSFISLVELYDSLKAGEEEEV